MEAHTPQRSDLGDEFGNPIGRQARDPLVADDRCTSRVPHHATMINGQGLDASPPTMHALARFRRLVVESGVPSMYPLSPGQLVGTVPRMPPKNSYWQRVTVRCHPALLHRRSRAGVNSYPRNTPVTWRRKLIWWTKTGSK